ncbi:hypothetical protein [Diadegma fenestrale ichnovirus]|nr:hypothetical protein [Diadegma fenestrale ichnovirus]
MSTIFANNYIVCIAILRTNTLILPTVSGYPEPLGFGQRKSLASNAHAWMPIKNILFIEVVGQQCFIDKYDNLMTVCDNDNFFSIRHVLPPRILHFFIGAPHEYRVFI